MTEMFGMCFIILIQGLINIYWVEMIDFNGHLIDFISIINYDHIEVIMFFTK